MSTQREQQLEERLKALDLDITSLQHEERTLRAELTNIRAEFKLGEFIDWDFGKSRRLGKVIEHRLAGDVISYICKTFNKNGKEGINQEVRNINQPARVSADKLPRGVSDGNNRGG